MIPVEHLKTLTAGERRRLKSYICGWCDISLCCNSCGSMYGPPCGDDAIITRRQKCLAEYRPRSGAERRDHGSSSASADGLQLGNADEQV